MENNLLSDLRFNIKLIKQKNNTPQNVNNFTTFKQRDKLNKYEKILEKRLNNTILDTIPLIIENITDNISDQIKLDDIQRKKKIKRYLERRKI
jgi:hypothetical protein